MKFFPLVIVALLLLVSCTKDPDEALSASKAHDLPNIAYGTHAQQKFDMYLPAGRSASKTKVFIFIHGGAWVGGDKSDFSSGIPHLKQTYFPKYAVVNMNYVLANIFGNPRALPNQINDIQAVIDFITAKSEEWQVKPEFVLCGHSAGAHLSMYYAYTKNNPNVKAVVSLAGPSDFDDPAYTSNAILGIVFSGLVDPAIIPSGMTINQFASPVTWIKSGSTPTIAFFGSTDTGVPVNDQKARLENKLQQYNVPHEIHIWNGDHNAFALEPQLSDNAKKIKAFLAIYNP